MNDPAANSEIEVISAAAARWVARRDAGLGVAGQREFEQWLAADSRHARALRHYEKTWSAFDRADDDGSAEKITRAVAARGVRRQHRRLTAVAALALVVLGGGFFSGRMAGLLNADKPGAPTAVLRRPETRTLADGSIVELRPGAVIAVDFSGPLRRVTLQKGEAHFQVAKDKTRAFVVSAGGVETRAVGTAFSVGLGRTAVEVLVTEGRVAVSHVAAPPVVAEDGAEAAAFAPVQHFVDAGRRLVLETTAAAASLPAVTEVAAPELAERLAWRSARLEFSDTPLAEAVALMNRTGGEGTGRPALKLVIDAASPGLSAEPVSGIFRANNAETFVRMLELSLGVQAERRSEGEIVLRKAK